LFPKRWIFTNFLKNSWFKHHVKVFAIHYVNGINWGRIHFLRWIRFWTGSSLSFTVFLASSWGLVNQPGKSYVTRLKEIGRSVTFSPSPPPQ
jgi:hypothetical protein